MKNDNLVVIEKEEEVSLITLNDESVDVSFVQSLVSMGVATLDEDGNEIYRPAEIISVEGSE